MSNLSRLITEVFVAPRNDQECQIVKIWEEVLGIQPIGVRENFFDLEGDSLRAVDLFAQIEKKFGKKLPITTLFQAGTVEALAQIIGQGEDLASRQALVNASSALLKQDKSQASWSSLVEIQPNGSMPPLFCIHPLGGGILGYRSLALHLGADQPVYGLQPQGLDGKQAPYTRVEDMALHYIQEIKTFQPNGPYFLAGYSFGGVVAFEIAQQLLRQGEKVGILTMIDTVRPGCYERASFLIRVFLHLNNILRLGPAYLWRKVRGWREWINYYLKQRYKRYVDVAQHALYITRNLSENNEHLEVIDANVQALENYVFQVYPGSMTLLRTEDHNRDEAVGGKYDLYFGWRDLIVGELDVHYIPGSHLSVINEPHVQVLAEKMRVCLEKAFEALGHKLKN